MISPVTSKLVSEPNFKKSTVPTIKSIKKDGNYEIITYETEASSGKKWGVGLASAFCCGLGQLINGDWGKAVGFFLGACSLSLLAGISVGFKKHATGPMLILGGLGALGVNIWSIVDAVKNAKSESIQVVPLNIEG